MTNNSLFSLCNFPICTSMVYGFLIESAGNPQTVHNGSAYRPIPMTVSVGHFWPTSAILVQKKRMRTRYWKWVWTSSAAETIKYRVSKEKPYKMVNVVATHAKSVYKMLSPSVDQPRGLGEAVPNNNWEYVQGQHTYML